MAGKCHQALLGEFQRHAQLYGAFSVSLGLLFGAMDGPSQPKEKLEVSMEDWRKSIPAAPRPGESWGERFGRFLSDSAKMCKEFHMKEKSVCWTSNELR